MTNRALNLALLAEGTSEIVRPLEAEDSAAMVGALETVGFAVERIPEGLVTRKRAPVVEAAVDCAASGTMLRFLTASLATIPGRWTLDGTNRLRQRPLAPLIRALRELGAKVECLEAEGFAPLRIAGGRVAGGEVRLDAGDSSQFLSALLMASARAERRVEIEVTGLTSSPYVDLTLQAMGDFGLEVQRQGDVFSVEPQRVQGRRFEVEGDYSSACYFGAAAALTGGEVRLAGLRSDSRQGDQRFFSVLERMGSRCGWQGDELVVCGPERLEALADNLSDMPDQVPTLAALAPFATGTTRIAGVGHLRLKESDRLTAVAEGLGEAGVGNVEEFDAELWVPGVWSLAKPPNEPITIDTVSDHRIAMAFAVLGLRRPGLSIADPGVVAKSYPDFWDDFEGICPSPRTPLA